MMNRSFALLALLLATTATDASAQWVTTHEQFYLQAPHNWRFRRHYPGADRLFNAFDYGHAILYETLWRHPNGPPSRLEEREYDFITNNLLNRPPEFPLEETAIEPEYARLVPEAKLMFEWAHILHRQLYDVLADERMSATERDAEVTRLVAYYRTRRDIAFSTRPKNMELMEGQRYSLAFRQSYPKFNGLIWAYHWLQVGLYEPLLTGRTEAEQQTGVAAAVARFRQMLVNPPGGMPRIMPMTAAVAPTFARKYPEAAIIFDNLHAMHDVISDVLASPVVPRNRKRVEILLAARRYRDDTSFVMTVQEWREMAVGMGIENQGGPAVGFLEPLPEGTVARGAPMDHAAHGARPRAGVTRDSAAGVPAQHQHAAPAQQQPARQQPAAGQEGHTMSDSGSLTPYAHAMMRLHERMMADPAIRQRVASDSIMRRLMREATDSLPPEHRAHMQRLMPEPTTARPAPSRARPQPTARRARPSTRATTRPATPARRPAAKPPTKPAPKPAAKPADPHAGHKP